MTWSSLCCKPTQALCSCFCWSFDCCLCGEEGPGSLLLHREPEQWWQSFLISLVRNSRCLILFSQHHPLPGVKTGMSCTQPCCHHQHPPVATMLKRTKDDLKVFCLVSRHLALVFLSDHTNTCEERNYTSTHQGAEGGRHAGQDLFRCDRDSRLQYRDQWVNEMNAGSTRAMLIFPPGWPGYCEFFVPLVSAFALVCAKAKQSSQTTSSFLCKASCIMSFCFPAPSMSTKQGMTPDELWRCERLCFPYLLLLEKEGRKNLLEIVKKGNDFLLRKELLAQLLTRIACPKEAM